MNGKYILVDGQPVLEPDLMKWAQWFEKSGNERIVKKTKIGKIDVSTVFLGFDHSWTPGGSPLLYETMIFGGTLDQEMDRYSTRLEAVAGHKKMVERVKEIQ